MRKHRLGVLVLGLALCLAACGRQPPITGTSGPRDYDASLVSGGLTRTYHVHVPPAASAGQPLPLVLSLHGRLGTGEGQVRLTGMNAVADQYGFIVVYPDGYQNSWADGRGITPADKAGVDDVAFLGAVLAQVMSRLRVDATRVYVTGMSNGGYMTERLGCDLTARFAAIAVVAANFSQALAGRCAPAHPLPVLIIHGSDDPLVPEKGGVAEGAAILSTADSVRLWAALAGCTATPNTLVLPVTVQDGTSIQRTTYDGCQAGAQVVYYDVIGGGHTWPGGLQYLPVAVVGRTTRNLDASAVIWQFFASRQFTTLQDH